MNPDQLLAHFERISEAPDAVARLRRFILDLAIRGKLVEQDPREEPACDLLKRIQREQGNLLKNGATKAIRPPAIAEGEPPFSLPKSWRWSRLREIGHLSPRNKATDEHPASFVPMALISAEYGVANKHEVRPWGQIKTGYTQFAEGDVALAKITPCFENGKSTVFRGLTGGIGAGTTELHIVRPIEVCADYVLVFLKCPYFIESGVPKMTGTAGQKRVPATYFADSPFPLPPLAEQHRIVAKVDELMALCDRLEAAQAERERRRERLTVATFSRISNSESQISDSEFLLRHLPRLTTRPEQITQLRQSILNLAVRAKLVAPSGEAASDLRKRPQLEKMRLLSEGPQSSTDKIPFELPATWTWVRIRDLLLGDTQNGYSRKPDDAPDGIPILRISAGTIRRDGLVAEEEHKLIRAVTPDEQMQYELRPGDLLACRFNGNRKFVGRLALYSGYLGLKPIYPDKLIRLRLRPETALPKLVARFAESDVVRQDVETYCATTVGNWGISARNLKEVRIPLPPLVEQRRIVAKVDELMALCDRLEAALNIAQSENRQLLEASLHEALASAA